MTDLDIRPLDRKNVKDIICCPGGLEVSDYMKGPLEETLRWRIERIEQGMKGFISYQNNQATGFLEYMPAEKAPLPIIAPGAAVLMCFHWLSPFGENKKHLDFEKLLVKKTLEVISEDFTGLATIAWDHPIHFPLNMMEMLGFKDIDNQDYIHLVWHPFEEGEPPKFIQSRYSPLDLSEQGRMAVEQAYSNRCPYSIHNAHKVKEVLQELDDPRIQHRLLTIDTRQDVIDYSVSPWGWEWLFLNDERIDFFRKEEKELKKLIKKRLDEL